MNVRVFVPGPKFNYKKPARKGLVQVADGEIRNSRNVLPLLNEHASNQDRSRRVEVRHNKSGRKAEGGSPMDSNKTIARDLHYSG